MGKYMRKGKGAGKVAVMEVSQGALGVRTRAKTLALEQDRKLALARNASLKQQHPSSRVDSFQTSYLELRSRKLEKAVKEIERPGKRLARHESLSDVCTNSSDDAARNVDQCRMSPAAMDVRMELEAEMRSEAVTSLRTPDLSPKWVGDFNALRKIPIELGLSTPRATLDAAQTRSIGSGVSEGRPSSMVPSRAQCSGEGLGYKAGDKEWPRLADGFLHGAPSARCLEAEEASTGNAAGESGFSSLRQRHFRGSPVSSSSKDREAADDCPESLTRSAVDGQGCRWASHSRVCSRSNLRSNMFVDTQAIEELFAGPESIQRQEGKRFTERYNYDVVNDIPLQGHYEWVAEPSTVTSTTQKEEHP